MRDVIAYTDGGCRGNPGIGAWAFVLVDRLTKKALERAGGERDTTNNRMEMQAVIEALLAIRDSDTRILLLSDSKYLIGCATGWMAGWKKNGWKRKGGPLKNLDLLQRLDEVMIGKQISFRWVAGHSGHPGNEHVDQLGNVAMDRIQLGQDPAHERRFDWHAALD